MKPAQYQNSMKTLDPFGTVNYWHKAALLLEIGRPRVRPSHKGRSHRFRHFPGDRVDDTK